MKKSLTLTPDQETKIKAIDEQFVTAHKKLKADTSLSVGTWHNRMNKLKTDHQSSIKQVLTEAQWSQWTAGKGNVDPLSHSFKMPLIAMIFQWPPIKRFLPLIFVALQGG